MQLKNITDEVCPECGAEARWDERYNIGDAERLVRNEARTFACGKRVRWSSDPDHDHQMPSAPCPASQYERERRRTIARLVDQSGYTPASQEPAVIEAMEMLQTLLIHVANAIARGLDDTVAIDRDVAINLATMIKSGIEALEIDAAGRR